MSNTSAVRNASFGDSRFYDRLRTSSNMLLWLGLGMAALGIAAIVYPAVSTLVVELFVGWLLVFSGILTFLGAFTIKGTGPFFGAILLGLLSAATGVLLLGNPRAGTAALTMVVGIMFLMRGTFEVFFSFTMRPFSGWGGDAALGHHQHPDGGTDHDRLACNFSDHAGCSLRRGLHHHWHFLHIHIACCKGCGLTYRH